MLSTWTHGHSIKQISGIEPRLASWNSNNDPEQMRVQAYLKDVETRLQLPTTFSRNDGLYGLHMDIAVRNVAQLYTGCDLDNYLYPVAHHLNARHFRYASAVKHVGNDSSISIHETQPFLLPRDASWSFCSCGIITGSSQKKEWKIQLRDKLKEKNINPLGSGLVEMQWNQFLVDHHPLTHSVLTTIGSAF